MFVVVANTGQINTCMKSTHTFIKPPHGKQIQDWLKDRCFNACFTFNLNDSRVTKAQMVRLGDLLITAGEGLVFDKRSLPRELIMVTVAEQSLVRGVWHGHGAAAFRSRGNLLKFVRDFNAVMFDEAYKFMNDQFADRDRLPKVTCTPMAEEESRLWWSYINKEGFSDEDGDRFSFGLSRQR